MNFYQMWSIILLCYTEVACELHGQEFRHFSIVPLPSADHVHEEVVDAWIVDMVASSSKLEQSPSISLSSLIIMWWRIIYNLTWYSHATRKIICSNGSLFDREITKTKGIVLDYIYTLQLKAFLF